MTQDSMHKKGGLGRGLAALIPTGVAEDLVGVQRSSTSSSMNIATDILIGGTISNKNDIGAYYQEINLCDIQPNPRQPRQIFDEEALDELVHSIKEFGLMQPIVVRKIKPVFLEKPSDPPYQLIMGERRWRAAQKAGLNVIPAIIRDTEDENLLRDALLENIHRVQLNPLEEASAYQQLLDDFCVTHDELANRIGRSRPVITNTIRLLKLPISVQKRVAAGILSAGHARALLSLEGKSEQQEELASRIVSEGLSVRATEEAISLYDHKDNSSSPRQRRKIVQPEALAQIAEHLSNLFDTHVTISAGKRKGKMLIEFASLEDLERIVNVISVSSNKD